MTGIRGIVGVWGLTRPMKVPGTLYCRTPDAGRRTPDALLLRDGVRTMRAPVEWWRGPSRRASSPESCSSAPAGGRPPSRGRAPCSDCLDPRPDSHPSTDPRGLPALETGATPRTPLDRVRHAACLLLLALTASLPLAGAAQAHAQARSDAAVLPGGSTVAPASAVDKVGEDPLPAQFPEQPPEQPAVDDATHYQIRRALDGSNLPAWSGYQTGTSHKLTGLATGRRYDIQVRACLSQDADDCGEPSAAEGATVPSPPTSLGTSNATATGITLGWNRPGGHNEAVTQVGYNTNTGASAPNRGLADKTGTSHAFTGMNGGIQHKLFARTRVKHSQTGAMLSASAWASVNGTTTTPGAPSVGANTNGTSAINLTWPGVAGATAYQVRHIHTGGTQPGWPSTFVTSPHTLTSLAAGRLYDIQVVNAGALDVEDTVPESRVWALVGLEQGTLVAELVRELGVISTNLFRVLR